MLYLVLLSGFKWLLKLLMFCFKIINMSLTDVLHSMLAFIPVEVLAEDIWLELVVQDGKLEVREAKHPQKVSKLL